MLKHLVAAAGWLCLAGMVAGAAAVPGPVMPIDQLRPGQKGFVITVLSGTEPDSLPIEVIGVAEGSSPGSHLILIRGTGELTRTGVAQGMSGSPVFVDGKLLGAMAYAFNGAREPIAGVTPFGEMVDDMTGYFDPPDKPRGARAAAGAGVRLDLPSFPEWRARCAAGGDPTIELMASGRRARQAAPAGFAPIGLPVLIRSGTGGAVDGLAPILQAAGMRAVPSGVPTAASAGQPGGAHAFADSGGLAPGDAVSVNLIAGDMHAAAIGTVTWVDGNRVFAFGHPFIQGGAMEMPISRAEIHAIIPTRTVSFKIGNALEEVGALVADKRTGVGGVLGKYASRIPLHLTLDGSHTGGGRQEFHFDIARHELMSASLMASAISSALTSSEYALGLSTLECRLVVHLDDGRTVRRRDLFRTLNPQQTIGAELMAPVSYLIASTFSTFPVCSVGVEIAMRPGTRAAEVAELQIPRSTVRRGDTIPVTIRLLRHRQTEETRRVTLRIPETASSGRLAVMAGSPAAFFEWDNERAPDKYRPRSLDDLVRLIEEYPSDEQLIVRLYAPSRGVVLRGREISSLPPSKWHTLNGMASDGKSLPVGGQILDEVVLDTGTVILGGASLRLTVEP